MFLQGSQALVSGADSAVVMFPRPFSAVPLAVYAWIENLVDDPVLEIDAQVADRTETGFSVVLDVAPDSNNYTLMWFAGDAEVLFQATSPGRTVTNHPLYSGALGDNDFVLLTLTTPTVRTVRLRMSTLRAMFPNLVAVPASPTSPGLAGQIAFSSSHIYTHDGVLWGRTARTTTW